MSDWTGGMENMTHRIAQLKAENRRLSSESRDTFYAGWRYGASYAELSPNGYDRLRDYREWQKSVSSTLEKPDGNPA